MKWTVNSHRHVIDLVVIRLKSTEHVPPIMDDPAASRTERHRPRRLPRISLRLLVGRHHAMLTLLRLDCFHCKTSKGRDRHPRRTRRSRHLRGRDDTLQYTTDTAIEIRCTANPVRRCGHIASGNGSADTIFRRTNSESGRILCSGRRHHGPFGLAIGRNREANTRRNPKRRLSSPCWLK